MSLSLGLEPPSRSALPLSFRPPPPLTSTQSTRASQTQHTQHTQHNATHTATTRTSIPRPKVFSPPKRLSPKPSAATRPKLTGSAGAAQRISDRVKEEIRLGIRRPTRSKFVTTQANRKAFREKPAWNDDNVVGGGVNSNEKVFRNRSDVQVRNKGREENKLKKYKGYCSCHQPHCETTLRNPKPNHAQTRC